MEQLKPVKYAGLLSEMKRYGHTNKTLSNLLKVSESSISRRFSGEVEWTIDEINSLICYYGKTFEELFG